MLKIILNLILILFIIGLEETRITQAVFLNPCLCFIIFFALSKNNLSFLWPILGGLVLDYFSIFKFPIFTISFLITFLSIRFVSEKIITFRNFLSLIIFSFGGVIFYNIIFLILNSFTYFLKIENILVVLNNKYFLYLLSNAVFTFFILFIFKKKYDITILHS